MAKRSASEIIEELRLFPLFVGFPVEALTSFATIAVERDFSPGDALLEQGQDNNKLFFLRSGRLAIQVDGENVSELTVPGEIIGEMSLINRTPVAASVIARDKASAFEVSESFLDGLAEQERSKYKSLLDRVYASVLAERLAKTNEKAKRFETANRELAAAQERLRRLNEGLEREIFRRSAELVQKVRSLTESHLRPAQLALAQWAPAASAADAKDLSRSISEVIDFLKPMTDLATDDRSAPTRRVLLVDSGKKQQNVARLALGGTGIQLSLASSMEEFTELFASHDFDAILCDSNLKEAAAVAARLKPRTPLVILLGLDMDEYLRLLQEFPQGASFVSRDVGDRTFTIKNISTTIAKILNHDSFGLEKYLAWSTRIREAPVTASALRAGLIESMTAHFRSLGIRPTLLDRVHAATEELLMNALYDAPTDDSGKPLFNHLPRTTPVELRPDQQASLRYGTDGILLGVAVSDPFGALTKDVVMRYLRSCTQGAAGGGGSDPGKAGAGRGLKMLIDSSDLTVFNIAPRRRTEVICLFNLEANAERAAQPTFHLFHED